MSNYNIVHIFSDSIYAVNFIEFIEKHFDIEEHYFIVLVSKESKFLEKYKKYKYCSVTENKSFYFEYKQRLKKSNKIILHQFNKPQLMLNLLLFYPKAFEKMFCILWGGDTYFDKVYCPTFKCKVFEYIRRKSLEKITFFATSFEKDYLYLKNRYKLNAEFIKVDYAMSVDTSNFLDVRAEENTTINILIGNSADEMNNHKAILKQLAKYKDENINIFMILSYGGSIEYISEVIALGVSIFSDKFRPICEYMDKVAYAKLLQQQDICVFDQKRQMGVGNLILLLAMNKKIFLNHETSTYDYYENLGLEIYRSDQIEGLAFETFKKKNITLDNKSIILKDIEEEGVVSRWRGLFNV